MATRSTTTPNRFERRHPQQAAARRWATIYDAADYMAVHHKTVRNLIARGQLTAYRTDSGRVIRIDLNEIDALLEAGTA